MALHLKPVLIVAGPTASGKSSFALSCAEQLNGVVVNADSMQVYDGLHILTAHPSENEKAQFPHVLYGVLSPDESCSAARWCDMALAEIEKAHQAGQVPIVTGGTGFYIKSMTEGLSPIPEISDETRNATIAAFEEMGTEAFSKALATRDPDIAKRIDMQNRQRLIRAWEVLEATGKSLAYWQNLPKEGAPDDYHFVEVVLRPDREKLYARCDERFVWMVENGALDEVASFAEEINAGRVPENALLANALGFWELKEYLDGARTKEDAIEASQQRTRRYAKRQSTWFKNQISDDAIVLETIKDDSLAEIINRLQG